MRCRVVFGRTERVLESFQLPLSALLILFGLGVRRSYDEVSRLLARSGLGLFLQLRFCHEV